FPELNRLEAARRLQSISKLDEVRRHHSFENTQFGDEQADNRSQPPGEALAFDDVAFVEHLENFIDFMKEEPEPEFENLVDDDKQRLIVRCRLRQRLLELQQFFDF